MAVRHTGMVFLQERTGVFFEPAKEMPVWHTIPTPSYFQPLNFGQSNKVSPVPCQQTVFL